MLTTLILLTGLAFAQDADAEPVSSDTGDTAVVVEPGDLRVPDNQKPETVPVYRGTEIRFMDENRVKLSDSFKLEFQAYLVPEWQFDKLLASQENLGVCKEALNSCQEMSKTALADAQVYYQIARDQFYVDGEMTTELTQQVVELEHDLIREKQRGSRLKAQRNVAWAITGGLILGSVTVTAVAIGTL